MGQIQRRLGALSVSILLAGSGRLTPAVAQEGGKGALPKGDIGAIDAGKVAGKQEVPKRRNCFLDLSDPPGGNGVYAEGGKYLYLLAPVALAGAAKKKQPKGSVALTLFKIEPKARRSEAVLSLDHRAAASLVLHQDANDAINAVTAIAFLGSTAGCFEGTAGLVSVPLADKTAVPVKASGHYQLVYSPGGKLLVDMKRSAVVAVDAANFQTKVLRRVPAGERPLFFDPISKRLVTWHDSKTGRGLVDYDAGSASPTRRLGVKTGDRVVQQAGHFGVAHFDLNANTIDIQELTDWTGPGKPGAKFKLNVPPVYTVTSAGIDINLGKRLALVYGANFIAKQRWQRVFIYDYTKSEPMVAVPVTGNQYLNYAGIDPSGQYVVIEVRDLTSRLTTGIKVFDVTNRTFTDLDLKIPATK